MTETNTLDLVVDGVDFGEGPRWHEGRLWYSDFYQRAVYAVAPDGTRAVMFGDLPDRPSGLGWMPDRSLLVVFMTTHRVMREGADGALSPHADLSAVATGYCNDMVVDRDGNAYVGNFGFDLDGGGAFAPADLALVRADGTVEVAATGLGFPNGSVITPDDRTLIVGESFGGTYQAFTINDDATLADRRTWAEIPGHVPDGCSMDVEGGIWFADALGNRVVRVLEGGTITHTIPTPMPTYACALGGEAGTTLFVLCAPGSHPDQLAGKAAGAIYATEVATPHAGRP